MLDAPMSPTALALFELLDKKLDAMMKETIRVDYCNTHRTQCITDNGKDHVEIFNRLKECEDQCSIFKHINGEIPSEADILKAKSEAEEKATSAARAGDVAIASRIDSIDSRLNKIDDKLKILDVSYWSACRARMLLKSNKIVTGVVLTVLLSLVSDWLTLFGVVLGRIHDFMP